MQATACTKLPHATGSPGKGFTDLISPPAAITPKKNVAPQKMHTTVKSSHHITLLPLEWKKCQVYAVARSMVLECMPETQSLPGTLGATEQPAVGISFSYQKLSIISALL